MRQLASSLSERPKGILSSQLLANPKNPSQAYEVQDPRSTRVMLLIRLGQERRWIIKSLSNQI